MRCSRCGKDLPDELFYLRKNTGRRETVCRNCKRIYEREYIKKNREKRRLYWREYWKQRRNINAITEMNRARYILGGCKCYILNHKKRGEYKFNIVFTDGEIIKTDSFADFLSAMSRYKNF